MSESRRVTRENFYEIGEWIGAEECWELTAPDPAIFFETPAGLRNAYLDDIVTKDESGEVTVTRSETRKIWAKLYA